MVELYKGVKFRTEFVNQDLPEDTSILRRMMYWCNEFHEKELAPPYQCEDDRTKFGSFGNLSYRLKPASNSFVITASGCSLSDSNTPDKFVTVHDVDYSTGIVSASGILKPSSESMVHAIIYRLRPEVMAVFHGHSNAITKNSSQLRIPITSKPEPYGTIELVKSVEKTLIAYLNHYFIEMRDHGFLSMGINDAKSKRSLEDISIAAMNEAGELALRYSEIAKVVDEFDSLMHNAYLHA